MEFQLLPYLCDNQRPARSCAAREDLGELVTSEEIETPCG